MTARSAFLPTLLLGLATSCQADVYRSLRTTGKAGFVVRSSGGYEEIIWCEPPQARRPVATCYPTGTGSVPPVADAYSQEALRAPTQRPPRPCETAAECEPKERCETGSIGWKHCVPGK